MKNFIVKLRTLGYPIKITADKVDLEAGAVFFRNGTDVVAVFNLSEFVSCWQEGQGDRVPMREQ